MAYVSVPKDLTKVKNKVAFNLTKRQLICIGIGAAMGIPSYFLLRNVMGNSNAATVMVLLMLPAFLFAMYEKDGMHLEDVLIVDFGVEAGREAVGGKTRVAQTQVRNDVDRTGLVSTSPRTPSVKALTSSEKSPKP